MDPQTKADWPPGAGFAVPGPLGIDAPLPMSDRIVLSVRAEGNRIMKDPCAVTFGLPASLHIPIAAVSVAAIEAYVGGVWATKGVRKDGQPNAIVVKPRQPATDPGVKLWEESPGAWSQLHPPYQVWVHVDYDGYLSTYKEFCANNSDIPGIQKGYVLDHVQNRKAIRLRGRSHPYLRLCPVSREVNTQGGVNSGGEGMEKEYRRGEAATRSIQAAPIIYADPMDITKMLNIPPGTQILDGVRVAQALFY